MDGAGTLPHVLLAEGKHSSLSMSGLACCQHRSRDVRFFVFEGSWQDIFC